MFDWFTALAGGSELPVDATSALDERGFVVVPGPVPFDRMEPLVDAYTAGVAAAAGDDIRIGSTTTRVADFVNRGPAFDAIYIFPPLLEACCRVIGRPYKLSSLHARTLRPGMPAQELHVDVRRGSADWPLAGFILMIDEFRPDNGATRFVPGSHRWPGAPEDTIADLRADADGQVLAAGSAGSLLIFNGSAWHGHSANTGRRSARWGRFPSLRVLPGSGGGRSLVPQLVRRSPVRSRKPIHVFDWFIALAGGSEPGCINAQEVPTCRRCVPTPRSILHPAWPCRPRRNASPM